MNLKVKAFGVSVIVLSLTLTNSINSNAAGSISKNQSLKVITNMKAEIGKTKSKIAILNSQKVTDVANAFRSGGDRVAKLESDYESLKKTVQTSRDSALTRLTQQSVFKVMVSNISACGTNFQSPCNMNQTIAIPPTAKVDVEFLMKIGGFVPVDEPAYKLAKEEIATLDNSLVLAENKLNSEKAAAQTVYENAVDGIFKRYGEASMDAEDYLNLIQQCSKAASRASKTNSNYLSAFKNALVFDFNYRSIVIVAKTPFSDINSFVSLNVVRNAVKYSEIGDSIDSRYSDSRAVAFNKYYGDTFFDDEFESTLESSLNTYKKFAK